MNSKKIVIVDIDGTIAKAGDRLKYLYQIPKDWDSFNNHCDEDEPYSNIINFINQLNNFLKYKIIFCTGRPEKCREKTTKWLTKYTTIENFSLLMRKDGDYRHATLIKPELIKNINKEDVLFIIEDDTNMAMKWRHLGFCVLQVLNGEYEI